MYIIMENLKNNISIVVVNDAYQLLDSHKEKLRIRRI